MIEARYCEYRSQWTFPSPSSTLAIWTNSSSEHPRAHLSHCCFLPKSRAHASASSQHDLAITCFYACSYAASVLVIRVGGSLQTVVKVFTDVLRTSACCLSCWRGDHQSCQYDRAKNEWHLALRYRHFSLPQSSSASRYHTVGADHCRVLRLDPVKRPEL